jgi:hypothetical protein
LWLYSGKIISNLSSFFPQIEKKIEVYSVIVSANTQSFIPNFTGLSYMSKMKGTIL